MSRDSESYRRKNLGDETARVRFVREARAAASVLIPTSPPSSTWQKGARLLHAMEFVEGEARQPHQALGTA